MSESTSGGRRSSEHSHAAAGLQTPATPSSGERRIAGEIELVLRSALADRYAVDRLIGRGGMATVYLAHDLRHERRVALKVLDRELGAVLGIERFLGEIRVTASLQHPNILPLFDSGEANGLLFYVTPFVEGESLRARLSRERQLPVDEAVRLAVGVASALQYAHRQGVIHRDLKPDNILLQEGQPLLADFGIAIAVSNAGGHRVTQTGLSLGTPQYMSPEQATADQHVDGRSDIYSLGSVLYEMLTGDPPHTGSTAQAIIARVVTERPRPVRSTRESVPPHVAAAVERALAKIPADRFASAQEFAEALQGRGAAAPLAREEKVAAARRRSRDPVVYALGALALAATLAAGALWRSRPAVVVHSPVRFTLDFAAGEGPVDGFGATYAVSPDGRQIVYSGRAGNASMLYVRPVDQLVATPIDGTEGAMHAAFSADGRWLAFNTRTEIRKIPTAGGTASTLATGIRIVLGLTWIGSERLAFFADGALMAVAATGGTPTILVAAGSGAPVTRAWPLSLGGDVVVFSQWMRDSTSGAQLAVADLARGTVTSLGIAGATPLGMIEGELVYGSTGGTLMAVPLDPDHRTVSGEAAPVLDGVLTAPLNAVRAALSASGSLLYVRGTRDREVVEMGAGGVVTPLPLRAGGYQHPRLSPDGRRLALIVESQGGQELRVFDLTTGAATMLANAPRFTPPSWARDGRTLVYGVGGRDSVSIWRRVADASAPAVLVAQRRGIFGPTVISPDGRWIVYGRPPRPSEQVGGLWYTSLTGDSASALLVPSSGSPIAARFSADGQRVAYASDESGQMQVYVRDFPGKGGAVQISPDGGTQPVWSGDGKRLYYRNGGAVFEATLAPGRSLIVQSRNVLAGNAGTLPELTDVDAAASGNRVIALRDAGRGPTVVVVHDWWEELRQRLQIQRTK
ncbi:MAG: protein kinase [Gemmatimonadota bacterium]